ncbi:hypothetical protein NQ315_014467 [Exocentrus adspersus]|uniref:DUF4817 domain-containing protein n=1 Tax=Exocentrus adspersus TaxID=1586481 RepID=A0AAV8VED3_9CUCU|nr:hypothetical protein NQ315_014467 [Exocentrus adspersus]
MGVRNNGISQRKLIPKNINDSHNADKTIKIKKKKLSRTHGPYSNIRTVARTNIFFIPKNCNYNNLKKLENSKLVVIFKKQDTMQFTNEELADIIYVYGFCDGNARAACREYRARYPNRRQPYREVFSNAFRRLRESGIKQSRSGGPRPQHTVAQEIAVVDAVLDDPTISTRRISTQLQLPHNFVWKTINRELLHPYHRQKVHHLLPGDEVQRLAFCNWLLEQNEQNPSFISEILWTDESIFTRNGINNTHNEHTWSLENPHSVRIRGFQQRFSVNAWCGIFNRQMLPIQILPNRLNADAYLPFLETNLQDLLDDIPIGLQNRMWYQQ